MKEEPEKSKEIAAPLMSEKPKGSKEPAASKVPEKIKEPIKLTEVEELEEKKKREILDNIYIYGNSELIEKHRQGLMSDDEEERKKAKMAIYKDIGANQKRLEIQPKDKNDKTDTIVFGDGISEVRVTPKGKNPFIKFEVSKDFSGTISVKRINAEGNSIEDSKDIIIFENGKPVGLIESEKGGTPQIDLKFYQGKDQEVTKEKSVTEEFFKDPFGEEIEKLYEDEKTPSDSENVLLSGKAGEELGMTLEQLKSIAIGQTDPQEVTGEKATGEESKIAKPLVIAKPRGSKDNKLGHEVTLPNSGNVTSNGTGFRGPYPKKSGPMKIVEINPRSFDTGDVEIGEEPKKPVIPIDPLEEEVSLLRKRGPKTASGAIEPAQSSSENEANPVPIEASNRKPEIEAPAPVKQPDTKPVPATGKKQEFERINPEMAATAAEPEKPVISSDPSKEEVQLAKETAVEIKESVPSVNPSEGGENRLPTQPNPVPEEVKPLKQSIEEIERASLERLGKVITTKFEEFQNYGSNPLQPWPVYEGEAARNVLEEAKSGDKKRRAETAQKENGVLKRVSNAAENLVKLVTGKSSDEGTKSQDVGREKLGTLTPDAMDASKKELKGKIPGSPSFKK